MSKRAPLKSRKQASATGPVMARRGPPTRGMFLQPELKVGPSNDRFEREADAMADKIVNMNGSSAAPMQGGLRRKEKGFTGMRAAVQRRAMGQFGNAKLDDTEEDQESLTGQAIQGKFFDGRNTQRISRITKQEQEDRISSKPMFMVQRQCEKCGAKNENEEGIQPKLIQRHGGKEGFTASKELSDSVTRAKSGGQPLPEGIRAKMEEGFDADFSAVRIHTDAQAAANADSMGARAFTHHEHVHFNHGEYNPSTKSGEHLLAHELTHVVQQGGAGPRAATIQAKSGHAIQRQTAKKPDPLSAREKVSRLVDTIKNSEQYVGEILGEVWEHIKQHWPHIRMFQQFVCYIIQTY